MARLHLLGLGGLAVLGLDRGELLGHQHEVVAELGLDRVGDLALGERKGDFVELLDHRAVLERAEVAALRGGRAGGVGLGELGELRRALGLGGLVDLGLEVLDLLERVGFGRGGLGVVGDDVRDDLLGLGLVVGARGLGLLVLEHLVDHDAGVELGARALLAERKLGEVLVDRLGGVGLPGEELHHLVGALGSVGVGHHVAGGLRHREQGALGDEALHDLRAEHLLRVLKLLGGDPVALRLDERLDVRVDLRAHQLLAGDGQHRLVRLRSLLRLGGLDGLLLLAAPGDNRAEGKRRSDGLDVHFSFSLSCVVFAANCRASLLASGATSTWNV